MERVHGNNLEEFGYKEEKRNGQEAGGGKGVRSRFLKRCKRIKNGSQRVL